MTRKIIVGDKIKYKIKKTGMSKTYVAAINILSIWCIFFFLGSFPIAPLNAQSGYPIKVGGVFDDAKIVLTWAPTNDTLWSWGNKYGYSIARIDAAGKENYFGRKTSKPYPHQWFIQPQRGLQRNGRSNG
jgi:hypothetical protein